MVQATTLPKRRYTPKPKAYRSLPERVMGPRNLIILFFSTVAVSLVLLVIIFSLFFKNLDFSFDTKLPESAPDLKGFYQQTGGSPSQTRADGVHAHVQVPGGEAMPALPRTGFGQNPDNPLGKTETPPPASDIVTPANEPATPEATATNPATPAVSHEHSGDTHTSTHAPVPVSKPATQKPIRIDPDSPGGGSPPTPQ